MAATGCWWLLVPLCTCSILAACPKDCSCGLDLHGRRQAVCPNGGMTGPIPVKEFDLNLEVLKISAPPENENSLTIGPIFQGFQSLEEVHISGSNIPAIGKHSFWGVPTLRLLNLTDNNISQVLDNNFRGLVNLVELHLDRNRIESMSSGTFHHLSELRILSLRYNRIKALSPRLFLKLGKLRTLDLSHNDLEHLDPDVFKDVQELRTFSCRGCQLRNMNPHMYSLLSSLAHLDLGDNQFMYLDREEFRDLRKLVSLRLDGNHFPVVLEGTFQSQGRLQYLNLGRSHIAKVTNHAFDNLTSLLELDLSYNKLDRLEPITFQPLGPNLRSLQVSGNNIRIEEFTYVLQVTPRLKDLGMAELDMRGGLPMGLLASVEGLKHLNLSGNELTRFPTQLLAPVPGLSSLDLSRNKLFYLDDRGVSRLEILTTVHLAENPWACDLCHILPLLRSNTSWARSAVCHIPYNLRGRELGSLAVEELSRCGSGLDYKEEGFAGLALTHRTQLGLLAAGSALALLVLTLALVLGGILYQRSSSAIYYTDAERRKAGESAERMVSSSTVDSGKKVSIATIDEITKDTDLEAVDS